MFKLVAVSLSLAALAALGQRPAYIINGQVKDEQGTPARWRVWAVDREGREGFKSPWRFFVYLK